jgi:hypothetical protein
MSYDSKDIAHWERSSKDPPPSTWQVVLVQPKTRTKEKDHLFVNLYFTSLDTTKKRRLLWMTKPVFRSSILEMHFVENSVFGKILKLFIRSDYAERNCVWLVF